MTQFEFLENNRIIKRLNYRFIRPNVKTNFKIGAFKDCRNVTFDHMNCTLR